MFSLAGGLLCYNVSYQEFLMKIAIYPGSFDPIHNGHLDVIERAAKLCDKVIVAVARNSQKSGLFSTEERLGLIEEVTGHIPEVEITAFEGLLVDFFEEKKANAVVRGLRAVSDFEYEFQMALMNRNLSAELETIFLVPSQETIYLSSRIIKEVARLKGDIDGLVPVVVKEALGKNLREVSDAPLSHESLDLFRRNDFFIQKVINQRFPSVDGMVDRFCLRSKQHLSEQEHTAPSGLGIIGIECNAKGCFLGESLPSRPLDRRHIPESFFPIPIRVQGEPDQSAFPESTSECFLQDCLQFFAG